MAAHTCPKCGKLRKVDNQVDKFGWQQPPCYNCGDPGYYEVHGAEENPARLWVTAKNQEWVAEVSGLSLPHVKALYYQARTRKETCTIVVRKKENEMAKDPQENEVNGLEVEDRGYILALPSRACAIVDAYIMSRLDKSDEKAEYEVYVVWFSKTLQNWKALLSSTLPDGKYYEVTYDGNMSRTYLDVYVKVENVCIKD